MTSEVDTRTSTGRPAGMRISFAVVAMRRPPESRYRTSHHHILPTTSTTRLFGFGRESAAPWTRIWTSSADSTITGNTTPPATIIRSEEHTSELQSLMRISYAVLCLKKKTTHRTTSETTNHNKKHTTIAKDTPITNTT